MGKVVNQIINQATKAIFITLIVGIIIGKLGEIISNPIIQTSFEQVSIIAKGLMGPAIGLSIAQVYKLNPVACFVSLIIGAISAHSLSNNTLSAGDPLSCILVTSISVMLLKRLSQDQFNDVIILPLVGCLVASCLTFVISPLNQLVTLIGSQLNVLISFAPILTIIILTFCFGFFMSGPFSSVLFSILLGVNGQVALVILAATCAQMMSYGVMSISDNGLFKSVMIFFGTSKLQFSNTLKNKWLFIPPIVASIVAGLVGYFMTNATTTTDLAGLGWCMFSAPIITIMNNYDALWELIFTFIILPLMIGASGYFLLRKLGKIKKGDLKL